MLSLFGVPFYHSNINLTEKEKNILIKSKYERIEKLDNGFITLNRDILNNKNAELIKNKILFHLNIFLYNYLKVNKNIKFKLLNSWVIKHNKGDWSQRHNHKNSFISGVLYLKTNINSGDFILHNTSNNILSNTIEIDYDTYNLFNSDLWYVTPKNGDIIFFPSQIDHSVSKNLNNDPRYSCAFNFFPYGSFGDSRNLNSLELHIRDKNG